MFFKLFYGEGEEVLINPNCHIRLIYDYIRLKVGASDDMEIDVCDVHGDTKHIYEQPYHLNGLEIFEQRKSYYLLAIRKLPDGSLRNPSLAMSPETTGFHAVKARLKKAFKGVDEKKSKFTQK